MYQKFKQYFEISRREFRGMIVLFILLILIYLSPYIYERLTYNPIQIKIEALGAIKDQIKESNPYQSYDNSLAANENLAEVTLFPFDPNNLSLADWMKLGLSEKQANIIKKYQAKGGKFYKKEDLRKIYSISEKQYSKLEPYIRIPERENANFQHQDKTTTYKTLGVKTPMVAINSADSTTLTAISGIGPAFASRILKYRKRLGGFHTKEQLKEVYGIDSLKYQQIQNQIEIDLQSLRSIQINKCTFDDLRAFPYLSYKQMNAIIAYRKQHGEYKNIEDLDKIAILNAELIKKIKPYIEF